MTATITTFEASEQLSVLGETLRPLLTNAMGSTIEIFDTSGPSDSGPPPHVHPWEEIYVVLDGELEVTIEGDSEVLRKGATAHVPSNTLHSYRNVTDCYFLTITSSGNATEFFTEVASDIEMDPPDIAGVIRVGKSHDIEFLL
jgi:quercetin dioxygenase-like cupin family protein